MEKTRVVHCKIATFDVYIGRPSKWGNPFSHLKDKTRAIYVVKSRQIAIEKYEEWIFQRPELLDAIKAELKGKVLGCWCKPASCHGDVLARMADAEDMKSSTSVGSPTEK